MEDSNVRLKKEYKLRIESENFKGVFGTTNRINPTVLYIKLNTWIKYHCEAKDYDAYISNLNYSVKMAMKKEIKNTKLFNDSFFYTPNLKKVMFNTDKAFYGCFEFTIKQKDLSHKDISKLKETIENMTNSIIKVIENNANFSFNIKNN